MVVLKSLVDADEKLFAFTTAEFREWWWHVNGCTLWFQIDRDTVTHEIKPVEVSPK